MASGIFRAFITGALYFEVRWSQSVRPSNSALSYELYLRATQYGVIQGTTNRTVKISANGISASHIVDLAISPSTDKLLASGTLGPIYHNANGTCSVDLSIESEVNLSNFVDDTPISWVRDSEEISFDPILIAAFIGGVSKITDGQPFNVGYSNMALDVSKVQLYIYIKENNSLVATKSLSAATATSTTYPVTLTSAEHTTIRNYSYNKTYVPLTLKLKTTFKNGSEVWSQAFSTTWNVANASVSLSPSIEVTDGLSLDLTGSTTKIIKGVSDVAFAFNATASPGAVIAKYELHVVGSKYVFTSATGNITDVDSSQFVFKVYDSRGAGNYEEVITPFVDYVPVTCVVEADATVFTSDTQVTIPLIFSGQYFNGSFGARDNIIDLQYRYKINSGSFNSWTRITPTLSGNTYRATANISTSYDAEITVEVKVQDQITNTTTTFNSTVTPVFDWGAEDFSFNVPVTMNEGVVAEGATLNGSVSVNGYTPLCIVEQGTDSVWTYRKYSDGTSECWGGEVIQRDVSKAWGYLVTSGGISGRNFPSGLFVNDAPICNIFLNGGYAGGWIIRSGDSATLTSTTNTGSYEIVRGVRLDGGTYYVRYYARGRWK